MSDAELRRATGAAALIGTVLLIVGFALVADIPSSKDAGAEVASYFQRHDGRAFVFAFVVAGGLSSYLAFYAGLFAVLPRTTTGDDFLRVAGLAGGITWISIIAVAGMLPAALAFRDYSADPDLARFLLDAYSLLAVLSGWPAALSLAALAWAGQRSGLFARWVAFVGFAAAAVHVASAAAFARDGVFSPAFAAGFIAPLAYFAWVVALGVGLIRPRTDGEVLGS